MAVQMMPVDPNARITDLLRWLADDSKRLAADEVRLAKLELRDAVHRGGQGAMCFGIACGVAIVATVALTLLLVTLVGRIADGHMWIGAVLTGVVEIVVGAWMVRRGLTMAKASARGLFANPDRPSVR